MFKVKCAIVKVGDRGVYVCQCPIICNTDKSSVDIFSDGIQVFVQTFFYKQLSGEKNLVNIVNYLESICAVFSLHEFEHTKFETSTLTFDLTVDFYEEKLKDSITFSVEALLGLIDTLKDNYSILEYKLANA